MKLSCMVQKDLFPVTNKLIFTNSELKQLVSTKMLEMKKKELANGHKDHVSRETERIRKIKEDLELQKQVQINLKKKSYTNLIIILSCISYEVNNEISLIA